MLNRFLSRVDELVRIVKRGWGYDDVDTDNPNPTHVVNNVWQRVIAVLQGWDYASNERRLVSIDEFGRIGVNYNPTIGITPNIFTTYVNTTATLISQAKPNRSYIIIKNVGGSDIFLGYNNAVTVVTGYPLPPYQELLLDRWNVELWAIAGDGGIPVAVIER